MLPSPPSSLDPSSWDDFGRDAHRMLDDMLSHLATIGSQPVWRPIPDAVRERFDEPLPRDPTPLADAHRRFVDDVLPYTAQNPHPGFMGWVQGGGTAVGMVAEMLAAGLNANLGGRDQVPLEVEKQVARWVRALFGYPDTSSGLFVTGTSMATVMAVWIARAAVLGQGVRANGIADGDGPRLVGYASAAAHGCLTQAFDLAGLGTAALRLVPFDADFRVDVAALERRIAADREAGLLPFFVNGNAGTVDTGAIDDLVALADVARRERLWFHVDGAYGALGLLSPTIAPRLRGLERSDSVAFDFHKWGQVPYDAGFLIVRDGARHLATFSAPAAYLRRDGRGMAAHSPWPCDLGPDLSRGFRALKTWFTLKVLGLDALGAMIDRTCAIAAHLAARVERTPALELLAPVSLSIVCFRHRGPASDGSLDAFNAAIVADLQEQGDVAPSTTTIDGRLAIRAAIFNHRTTKAHVDLLVDRVVAIGAARSGLHDRG